MTDRDQEKSDGGAERIEKGHQPIREPEGDGAVAGHQPETGQGDDGPPSGGGSGKK